jgi:hypothetical protein
MSTLTEELESASLALEYALGPSGQTAPINTKPPSLSPYAARTIAAAGSAVRAVSLTIPTTSSERSRLVAAARLHAQKRTSQLQKAADNAAESLSKPIKVPTILSTMNVPRTAQLPPLPIDEPLQFRSAPLQRSNAGTSQNSGASGSSSKSTEGLDWIAVATEKKLRELTRAQEKQATILREIQEGQLNLKEQIRKEAEATAATNTALLRDQQQAHVAALKSTLKDAHAQSLLGVSTSQGGKAISKSFTTSTSSSATSSSATSSSATQSIISEPMHVVPPQKTTETSAKVISVPISLTRVPPPASSPLAAEKKRNKEMEIISVPIMITPFVQSRYIENTSTPLTHSLETHSSDEPIAAVAEPKSKSSSTPDAAYTLKNMQSAQNSTNNDKEQTLASLLQLMWEDVMKVLSSTQQNKSAVLSDDMILATLSTALMRSEQETGRAYAQSLRDTVTTMHSEVSTFSAELQALKATTQTFAKNEAVIADKARLAQVAAEDARRTIATAQAETAIRVADAERRLSASVSGVQAQVAATAATLSDAVAFAQKSNNGNSPLTALNEASQKIAVRQVLEAEVYEPMRILAVDMATLKDKVVTQEKLFQSEVKALASTLSSTSLSSSSQHLSSICTSVPTVSVEASIPMMEKISELSSTVAKLQAEVIDLHTKRDSIASIRLADSSRTRDIDDDDDDDNDENDIEGSEQGPFLAIRRGLNINDIHYKFDAEGSNDLSLGEVILSENFENGEQVQFYPLESIQ